MNFSTDRLIWNQNWKQVTKMLNACKIHFEIQIDEVYNVRYF